MSPEKRRSADAATQTQRRRFPRDADAVQTLPGETHRATKNPRRSHEHATEKKLNVTQAVAPKFASPAALARVQKISPAPSRFQRTP